MHGHTNDVTQLDDSDAAAPCAEQSLNVNDRSVAPLHRPAASPYRRARLHPEREVRLHRSPAPVHHACSRRDCLIVLCCVNASSHSSSSSSSSSSYSFNQNWQNAIETRNRKHRRAAAKPAACANSLGLSVPNWTCNKGPVVYAYKERSPSLCARIRQLNVCHC